MTNTTLMKVKIHRAIHELVAAAYKAIQPEMNNNNGSHHYLVESRHELFYLIEYEISDIKSPRFKKLEEASAIAKFANRYQVNNDYDTLAAVAKVLNIHVVDT